jgi:hypothetical protein
MGVANLAMQLWRARKLVSVAKPVEVDIPAPVAGASKSALAQLWTAAIQISRESLISAQLAFDEQAEVNKVHCADVAAAHVRRVIRLVRLHTWRLASDYVPVRSWSKCHLKFLGKIVVQDEDLDAVSASRIIQIIPGIVLIV